MSLVKAQPLFDSSTHYRIEVLGRVDLAWLQSFNSSVEIAVDATEQRGGITVLELHTDQAGIVGLVRRLHGLGVVIKQLQVI
jgi:hypothetical protein